MNVPDEGEAFLPFPRPRAAITDGTHFRSTWLTVSQAALRERGYGDAYLAAVDPAYAERLASLVAGVWLPMDVARAHYAAADSLGLSTLELIDIGASATRRANATALSFAVRLARGAGANPWTMLAQVQRVWDRTSKGGAVAVFKLGPKEARIEVVGYPLAYLRYNRITFRGICSALLELFCQRVYIREVARLCDHRSLGFRVSWA